MRKEGSWSVKQRMGPGVKHGINGVGSQKGRGPLMEEPQAASLRMDNASYFKSEAVQAVLEELQIQPIRAIAYTPQTNGLAERLGSWCGWLKDGRGKVIRSQ